MQQISTAKSHNNNIADSILQGTYSISWSYQGPPGCVWLYRGGERVSEAFVANMMVGQIFNLAF